jgi:hypothetical protein
MFILGGASTFGTAVLAASMSLTAYTLATAGIGLLVAGVVAGGYLLIKSNWTHEEANEEAIKYMLRRIERGK